MVIISYQQLILTCAFLTFLYSFLSPPAHRNLEYYLYHYTVGFAVAAVIGLLVLVANAEGIILPINVSFLDIKVYIPMLAIVVVWLMWNTLKNVRNP